MKVQIRRGVFETNSSMTHALTLCTADDFYKWQEGEMYWNRWDERLQYVDEVNKILEEDYKDAKERSPEYYEEETFDDEFRRDNGFITYEEYCDEMDYETFDDSFTTPNGETVYAFGYYGHD